jgi:3-oxoadipate enol-lactonase
MKVEKEMIYTDAGQGETIVLLHGHPLNRTMWRAQIEFLQTNYRVIAPDLRGYGETSVSGDVSTMKETAGDVAALLHSLGLEKVILGGLSMGGYVTFEFYNQFPNRVRALILADTKPSADTEEARLKRFETAEKALKEGMSPIAAEMLPKALAPQNLETKPEIVSFVKEMMLSTKPEGASAGLRGMAERTDHTALLEKINVPTLIIVGAEDQMTPPAEAEKMHRLIKDSQLTTIPAAGHISPVEQPEAFNKALKQFLQNLT